MKIKDEELMDFALKEFQLKAKAKFKQGIKEHNPNGDKGLARMTSKQRIRSSMEEVMDLWFYLFAELMKIDEEAKFERESLLAEYHDELNESRERSRGNGWKFDE